MTCSDKINFSYKLEGTGPVLLFLHGWGVNKDIWKQQAAHFKEHFRVLTVDLPGHGETPWKDGSFGGIADGILALLASLKIDGIHLVGSSMGGLMGLKMYEKCPGIFHSLTFVGSLPKFTRSPDFAFGLGAAAIAKLRKQVSRQYPSIVHIFFRSLFSHEEREDRKFKWARTFRQNQKIPEQKALLAFLDLLEGEDLRAVLPGIKVPVLCVNGSEDAIVPDGYLDYIQSAVPQAQCYRMERAGHFPFVIRSGEFNGVLEKFLKSHKDT